MICPNCKTELVEVNGRYICSGCGREIPENEVMASDWGSGGTVRAGLYGAGTDEPTDADKPVAEYDTSLTESENAETASIPEVVQIPEETPNPDEPTAEEVLQKQTAPEPETSEPANDTGFYTTPEIEVITPEPVVETQTTPLSSLGNDIESTEILKQIQNDVQVTPEAVEPVPVTPIAEEIPLTVPVEPAPVEPVSPEAPVEQPEVVRDMFENTEIAAAPVQNDPGIYSDPMYENAQSNNPTTPTTTKGVPMPVDKRNNLIIMIAGFVLVLLFLIGGILAYLYLNSQGI